MGGSHWYTHSAPQVTQYILKILGSKTVARKATFSYVVYVCNLEMLFLPFQNRDQKGAHSDLSGHGLLI